MTTESSTLQTEPRPTIAESLSLPWVARIAILGFLVASADYLLYSTAGSGTGMAVFSLVAAAMQCGLWLRGRATWAIRATLGVLMILALRLSWQGSPFSALAIISVLVALAIVVRRVRLSLAHYIITCVRLPLMWALHFETDSDASHPSHTRESSPRWSLAAEYVIPLGIAGVFALLFTAAFPVAWQYVGDRMTLAFERWSEFLAGISLARTLFWLMIAVLGGSWLSSKLLHPGIVRTAELSLAREQRGERFYLVCRNTFVAVIAVFAVYLIAEFATLWFYKFPAGFHYSGFAHRGAAFLTLALGVSSLVLSVVFQYRCGDPQRQSWLSTLAHVWSAMNLLLALAALHRLWIYVEYNGMTRMRIIGFVGVLCVVAGFLVVMRLIRRQRSLEWLIDRQALCLGLSLVLLAVLPMDAIAHRYNMFRLLSSDERPAVQLAYHPISAEGFLAIWPLLFSDDAIIREGLRAKLMRYRRSAIDPSARGLQAQLAYRLLERRIADSDDLTAMTSWEDDRLEPPIERLWEKYAKWF